MTVCSHAAGTLIRFPAFLAEDRFTQTGPLAAHTWGVFIEDVRLRPWTENLLLLCFYVCLFVLLFIF